MITLSRSPLRISFIGGGTDFPNFYNKYSGGVISGAIDKYVYVSINKKFDKKIKLSYSKTEIVDQIADVKHPLIKCILNKYKVRKNIELISLADIPSTGTGLGSSSAFTLSTISSINKHLNNNQLSKSKLAELACEIELIKNKSPIGIQDQYACSYGGLNHISFIKNKVKINKKKINKNEIMEIEKSLILVYTNITRKANDVLSKHKSKIEKNKNIEFLKETNYQTEILLEKLNEGNIDYLPTALNISWSLKKKFNSSVSNSYIDKLINFGLDNGAKGAKLLGAGKGGFVLFLIDKRKKNKFISNFKNNECLEIKFDNHGTKVINF
jgi:D-glycero-alpha-D-manno-heptose-7-phosphate kinase